MMAEPQESTDTPLKDESPRRGEYYFSFQKTMRFYLAETYLYFS